MSPADELLVLDEAGNPVPKGTPGILFVRGPYTIQGYYHAPEHNQRSFTDLGYYRTGDIVVMTEAGNLQVVGRDKDQINRGGEKIAAEEVENHLLAHDSVHDAAVIAIRMNTLVSAVARHWCVERKIPSLLKSSDSCEVEDWRISKFQIA